MRAFLTALAWAADLGLLASANGGAIHDAVRGGDLAAVNALVAHDAGVVRLTDDKGRTPLHLAALSGRRDIVSALLAAGAPRAARDNAGRTALDAALARGREAVVDLLLEIRGVPLGKDLTRITLEYGLRSNTAVLSGPDGLLIVDTGEPAVAPWLARALCDLGPGDVKIVINTHPHGDHTGGNGVVGRGAQLITFANLEELAARGVVERGAEPLTGRAGRAFDEFYVLRCSGQEIHLIGTAGAHSDQDLLVYFRDAGVVHMGDLLLTESFPAVGGRVPRYLEILDTVLDVFPPETKFIAGHGCDATRADVVKYRAMLDETIALVRRHMEAGETVEQIQRADVLHAWRAYDEYLPFLDRDYWIQAIHDSYPPAAGAGKRGAA